MRGSALRPRVLLHELAEESWDRVIDINLKGVWLGMKYKIIQMLTQGGGTIVNTTWIMGLVGLESLRTFRTLFSRSMIVFEECALAKRGMVLSHPTRV